MHQVSFGSKPTPPYRKQRVVSMLTSATCQAAARAGLGWIYLLQNFEGKTAIKVMNWCNEPANSPALIRAGWSRVVIFYTRMLTPVGLRLKSSGQ
jgi:hypothetical protein